MTVLTTTVITEATAVNDPLDFVRSNLKSRQRFELHVLDGHEADALTASGLTTSSRL